jgi:hypothetical protein
MQLAGRKGGMSNILEAAASTVSPLTACYFIAVLVFMSYLLLSLFIAIVRVSFGQVRKERQRLDLLEQEALKREGRGSAGDTGTPAVAANAKVHSKGADATQEKGGDHSEWLVRQAARKLISFPAFENGVSLAILVNCVFLAMEYHGNPEW